jgi:hypothetical protein
MIPEALKKEIADLQANNKSSAEMQATLVKEGWPKKTVEDAFRTMNIPVDLISVPQEGNQIHTYSPPAVVQQITKGDGEIKEKNESSGVVNKILLILEGKRKFSVLLVGVVIALISAIQPSYTVFRYGIPFIKNLEKRVFNLVDEVVPEDLEVVIKNGEASTNVTEPYYITVNQSTFESIMELKAPPEGENQPQSRVRVLTLNTQGKIEDFERYQSLAMLTAENLVYYTDEGIQISPLSEVPDVTVNKKLVVEKINEINKGDRVVRTLTILLYLNPILIAFGLFMLFLAEVLFASFFIWVMGKLMQANLAFKNITKFTAALYALPYLLLNIIKLIPYVSLFYFFFYTAMDVLVISASYVFIKMHNEANSPVKEEAKQ